MKLYVFYLLILLNGTCFSQMPEGFVDASRAIPNINVELRYYGSNNFVGRPINGYHANKLILTQPTVQALRSVQKELLQKNLSLKVYDGYRPQRAVNDFIYWAHQLNDTINKNIFYPKVHKKDLFKEGYIASKSGHSRGSTVDLTIINLNTGEPLDMGSPYDYFGIDSWVAFKSITEAQKSNRMLLQNVMLKHGFRNYPKEWWHFTLKNEPYPDRYFDFPIE
ncbi:M15 family metallopeptidase [Aestuariivivens sediminis]|uniref:M15 family metallopeptidase n=1 Tax=Aestuariivivens sediminis TaxID=2913557 RepID=UPI001F584097|nr:M15 family metallopeptidase [Aestuariivivens sediminis]